MCVPERRLTPAQEHVEPCARGHPGGPDRVPGHGSRCSAGAGAGLDAARCSPSRRGDSTSRSKAVATRPGWFFIFAFCKRLCFKLCLRAVSFL